MESLDESVGYILYRHQLTAPVQGNLVLDQLHDYARIYLDGKLVGTLERHAMDTRAKPITLPITATVPARLDILVANDGRINSTGAMRTETKGITRSATLAGQPLTGWDIFPLSMASAPAITKTSAAYSENAPQLLTGSFTLTRTGDTLLDIHTLGKGAVWVNGHALGRFWNTGPQQTLYVPAPWLRKGRNELVAVDLIPSPNATVSGLDHPILDGPTPDATRSKQE